MRKQLLFIVLFVCDVFRAMFVCMCVYMSRSVRRSLVARSAPAYIDLSTSGQMTYPPPPPSYYESCLDIADLHDPQSRGPRVSHVRNSPSRSVVSISSSIAAPRSEPPTYEYAVSTSI